MRSVSRIIGVVLLYSLSVLPENAHAATIYACVGKALGIVRIVSSTTACTALENPISWNSLGPAGPQGPAGDQGPAGPQGPQGPAGVTAGISAAIFAEVVLDPDPTAGDNCYIDFWRGADDATGTPTGNTDECFLDFTLPAGQPHWGTAYECFTSIQSGFGLPWGTMCETSNDISPSGGPRVILQCLTAPPAGGAALTVFSRVNVLCVQ